MANEYICNDKDVLEDAQRIRNMTDEEFNKYIETLQKDKKD